MKFSYHVAKEFSFPNNILLYLATWNITYFFNEFKRGTKFEIDDMKSYMVRLSQKGGFDKYDFSKYIDHNRFDEIIDSYHKLSQIKFN